MARVFTPPTPLPTGDLLGGREKDPSDLLDGQKRDSLFLAGSIEQGLAEDWQQRIIDALDDLQHVTIFNPRRAAWDASWEQSIDNPQFRQQVQWELEALERADTIAMYFAPTTKAPISLLELGLHARGHKLLVFCPDGYWRKGNVDIVCQRYGIETVDSFAALIDGLRRRLLRSKPA